MLRQRIEGGARTDRLRPGFDPLDIGLGVVPGTTTPQQVCSQEVTRGQARSRYLASEQRAEVEEVRPRIESEAAPLKGTCISENTGTSPVGTDENRGLDLKRTSQIRDERDRVNVEVSVQDTVPCAQFCRPNPFGEAILDLVGEIGIQEAVVPPCVK